MNYSGIPISPHITVTIDRSEYESNIRRTDLRRLLLARNDVRAILRLPKSQSERRLFLIPEPLRRKPKRISYPERFRDADGAVIAVCDLQGQKLHPYWLQSVGTVSDIQGWCSLAHPLATVTRRTDGTIEITRRDIRVHPNDTSVSFMKTILSKGPESDRSWIPDGFEDVVTAVRYKAALNDRTRPFYLMDANAPQRIRQ